jgi:hypothetical protein
MTNSTDNVVADVVTAPISPEHSETVELKILLCLTLIHFLIQWSSKTQCDFYPGKPAFSGCKVVTLWKSGDYAANLRSDNGTRDCHLLTTRKRLVHPGHSVVLVVFITPRIGVRLVRCVFR